jgi:toxin ParE1/3/4
MDFKIFLSQEALSDLEQIVAYIAPHNPIAAEQMGDLLLGTAFSLRELVVHSYRIIYRVRQADMSVEIVRFWHGARGVPRIPPPN